METSRQRAERLVNPYRFYMFGNAERVIETLVAEFDALQRDAYARGYITAQQEKQDEL